ncbi:MAG TPA: hypothetical protein PK455_06815 [Caldisericia bacterium]|jgi:predicted CopG family antitoxin|nr:hypothetical protein [Caldisericia bacterium]
MKDMTCFTVRMPISLHKKAKEISKRENKSLSEVIRELTEEWLKKEEEKLLFDAFSSTSEEDIEFALIAQKEVIDKNELSKKI